MKKLSILLLPLVIALLACNRYKANLSIINRLEKKGSHYDSIHQYDTASFYYCKSIDTAARFCLAAESTDKKYYLSVFDSLIHQLTKRARHFLLQMAICEEKSDVDSVNIYGRICFHLYHELYRYSPPSDTIIAGEMYLYYYNYARFCKCIDDIHNAVSYYRNAIYWAQKEHNGKDLIGANEGMTQTLVYLQSTGKFPPSRASDLEDSIFTYLAVTSYDMDSLQWEKIHPREAYDTYYLMALKCRQRNDSSLSGAYIRYTKKCNEMNNGLKKNMEE